MVEYTPVISHTKEGKEIYYARKKSNQIKSQGLKAFNLCMSERLKGEALGDARQARDVFSNIAKECSRNVEEQVRKIK